MEAGPTSAVSPALRRWAMAGSQPLPEAPHSATSPSPRAPPELQPTPTHTLTRRGGFIPLPARDRHPAAETPEGLHLPHGLQPLPAAWPPSALVGVSHTSEGRCHLTASSQQGCGPGTTTTGRTSSHPPTGSQTAGPHRWQAGGSQVFHSSLSTHSWALCWGDPQGGKHEAGPLEWGQKPPVATAAPPQADIPRWDILPAAPWVSGWLLTPRALLPVRAQPCWRGC